MYCCFDIRDLRVKQHSELLTLKALDWAMFNGVVDVDGQTTLRGAAQLASDLHVGGNTALKSVEVDGSLDVSQSTVVQDLRVSKDLETIGKTDCGDVVLFHNGTRLKRPSCRPVLALSRSDHPLPPPSLFSPSSAFRTGYM